MLSMNGRLLECDNDCGHGCGILISQPIPWLTQALDAGWVVHLWKTPPGYANAHPLPGHEHDQPGHAHAHDEHGNDNHVLAYCDALCAYKGLRAKLLAQPDYARRIHTLERPIPK
jgi:hypothetical protein